MPRFKDDFPKKNSLIVVIHADTQIQVMRNASLAYDSGADGVFLINHNISAVRLMQHFWIMRREFPFFWAGVNILGEKPVNVMHRLTPSAQGLWADNAGITSDGESPDAERFEANRRKAVWKGLYFGGVAFKYQEEVQDVAAAAKHAVPFVDVITTSGDGTGMAPAVDKIRRMREAIGDHPLAIASGISAENVRQFMPYADCFLVATSISNSHTELNGEKVRELAYILSA